MINITISIINITIIIIINITIIIIITIVFPLTIICFLLTRLLTRHGGWEGRAALGGAAARRAGRGGIVIRSPASMVVVLVVVVVILLMIVIAVMVLVCNNNMQFIPFSAPVSWVPSLLGTQPSRECQDAAPRDIFQSSLVS